MQKVETLKDLTDLIELWSGELLGYVDVLKQQYPDAHRPLTLIEQGIAKLPFEVDVNVTTDFYD